MSVLDIGLIEWNDSYLAEEIERLIYRKSSKKVFMFVSTYRKRKNIFEFIKMITRSNKRNRRDFQPDLYGVVHLESLTGKEELIEILTELRELPQVTGCWLKLNGEKQFNSILGEALHQGFTFHHANGLEAVLGLWLQSGQPNSLPKGATHTVGVGAMVVDEADGGKVLVVKEKLGPARGKWKMVTGLVDIG